MSTPTSPAAHATRHPLLIAAAVAVIVFCGVGTAAILGWLPASVGGTPARTELSEIDRAMLASKLQDTTPATLAPPDERDRRGQGDLDQRERERDRAADRLAARERAALDNAPPLRTSAAPRMAAAEAAQDSGWCAHCGNIESVREVTQRAQGSGLGAAGGAILGGLLGNQVGGGNGRKLATVAGAVGGAVVGNQVEGTMKATHGYEIRVRLDDGATRTFHQQSAAGWRAGDRVKVVDGILRPAS
ncbi:glycine zipper 2TM domain-containing protein [Massilia antarctica]|uniref:glycine zipper 2TM domain-containing protein n=1 Tax=Massilia antarctica TaxID=2765360 RepID=UPI0006BB5E0C|nr:glycine zipper 2TM domain-containing protein [Massilia sp. H27-R4]MCY0915524.1 glycine zipper 2TM domain-containing protein [Massilia sp. H27-R4]CUI04125.1 Outer membrane lipoprotein slyB precursor [Janthinobacterium sp. CG23_2]CUU27911.1 Outer membrane lipoprotein slyB precursor [Janthinobacterium sp. CG23_2]